MDFVVDDLFQQLFIFAILLMHSLWPWLYTMSTRRNVQLFYLFRLFSLFTWIFLLLFYFLLRYHRTLCTISRDLLEKYILDSLISLSQQLIFLSEQIDPTPEPIYLIFKFAIFDLKLLNSFFLIVEFQTFLKLDGRW